MSILVQKRLNVRAASIPPARTVVDVPVERHHPDGPQRECVLRPRLRVVEWIEVELRVLVVAHDLHVQLPARMVASLDRFEDVLGSMAEVRRLHLVRLRLRQRLDSMLRLLLRDRIHSGIGHHAERLRRMRVPENSIRSSDGAATPTVGRPRRLGGLRVSARLRESRSFGSARSSSARRAVIRHSSKAPSPSAGHCGR
jgi:hypothetical protein